MNVQQLCHDLRIGPAHVFGDHSSCNPLFCKHIVQPIPLENARASEGEDIPCDDHSSAVHQSEATSLVDQILRIAATERENGLTSEMEATACSGYSASLSGLSEGLFQKVLACGDQLVMLPSSSAI